MHAPIRVTTLTLAIGMGMPAHAPLAQSAPIHAATVAHVTGTCFTRTHVMLNMFAEGLHVHLSSSAAIPTGGTPLHDNDTLTSSEDVRCTDGSTAEVTYTISAHTHVFDTNDWTMVGNASRAPHETEERELLARIAYLPPDTVPQRDLAATMMAVANSISVETAFTGLSPAYVPVSGVQGSSTSYRVVAADSSDWHTLPMTFKRPPERLYFIKTWDSPIVGGTPTVGVLALDLPAADHPVKLTASQPRLVFDEAFTVNMKGAYATCIPWC